MEQTKSIEDSIPDGDDFKNWVQRTHYRLHPELMRRFNNKITTMPMNFPKNQICRECKKRPIIRGESLCERCFIDENEPNSEPDSED